MARTVTLSAVTLDCPNPHELAASYAALLGVEVGYDSEEFAGLSFGGMSVGFQRAIDYPAADVA